MGLYLGSSKGLKITFANKSFKLNIPTHSSNIDVSRLKSFDGYILKSSDELFLIPKEDK